MDTLSLHDALPILQALVDVHCALMGSQYDGYRVLVNLSATDLQTMTLTNLPALKSSRDEVLNLVKATLSAAGDRKSVV